MELKWLEDFVCLARTGNFSRAAEERNVTQSAFSRRIKALECWLGSSLVDRSTYPTRLTQNGQDFLTVAQGVLDSLDEARTVLRDSGARTSRTVVIATQHSLALSFYPGWVGRLKGELGVSDVRMIGDNLHNCVHGLTEGACDLMISFTHPEISKHLDTAAFEQLLLGRDKLIPVSAPNDRGRPRFALPGRKDEPVHYLGYGPGSFLGRIVDIILGRVSKAHHLKLRYESNFAEALKAMAMEGEGLGWLPQSGIEDALMQGRLVRAGSAEWEESLDIRLFRTAGESRPLIDRIWRETELNFKMSK